MLKIYLGKLSTKCNKNTNTFFVKQFWPNRRKTLRKPLFMKRNSCSDINSIQIYADVLVTAGVTFIPVRESWFNPSYKIWIRTPQTECVSPRKTDALARHSSTTRVWLGHSLLTGAATSLNLMKILTTDKITPRTSSHNYSVQCCGQPRTWPAWPESRKLHSSSLCLQKMHRDPSARRRHRRRSKVKASWVPSSRAKQSVSAAKPTTCWPACRSPVAQHTGRT